MNLTLPQDLRALARKLNETALQIISPKSARGFWLDAAQLCEDAATLINTEALRAPVPELTGTAPLIVYFGNEKDREEFSRLVQAANPNLRSRNL